MLNAWLIWFLLRNKKKAHSNEPARLHPHHVHKGMSGAEISAILIIIAIWAALLTTVTSIEVGFLVGMVALIILLTLA